MKSDITENIFLLNTSLFFNYFLTSSLSTLLNLELKLFIKLESNENIKIIKLRFS